MFVVEETTNPADFADLPEQVPFTAVLAACAAEAERQAEGLRRLDLALGELLEVARRAATSENRGPNLVPALAVDLQQADGLRQAAEDLARLMALLARQPDTAAGLKTQAVRDCLRLESLQQRLLLPLLIGER